MNADGRAMPRRIREAGDSALLLELEPRIDPVVNARAVALASAVRGAAIAGVRDVVPTYRSVAVFFDPLQTRLDTLVDVLAHAPVPDDAAATGRVVEVPVVYGGEEGPDLPVVAAFAGLNEAEVVRLHAAATYRVFMLGFTPGFPYMGSVEETIAAPRLATPRLRVPARSVGIAGRQTGIYPQDTPGGWNVIGRATISPFDPDRDPPALFEPGDQVKFVARAKPETDEERDGHSRPQEQASDGPPDVTVLRPGMLSTIQDLGRWGYQDRGVPVAGPMDPFSHRLANLLVGNPPDAATLEATVVGPELRFEREVLFTVTGADLSATLDGRAIRLNAPLRARRGALLAFGTRRRGARAYIGFVGGIEVRPVLGSRATHVLSRMGGHNGRPLAAGDTLRLGERGETSRREPLPDIDTPAGGARLRVLPGPQEDFFDASALECLEQGRFVILPQSNRMGYRLGGARIPRPGDRDMISDAMITGGIQVPPSGEPILLMADRQTTGGYPQIATVITADLPVAGQLAPGDPVEFAVCTRREAMAALLAQEGKLLALA